MKVYTDGAARGNPGPAAIGFSVFNGAEWVLEKTKYIGTATNNEAEYKALIFALENTEGDLEVYSDSQLMIKQLTGEYKTKNARIKELREKVKELAKNRNIEYNLVPRENKGVSRVDKRINMELNLNT